MAKYLQQSGYELELTMKIQVKRLTCLNFVLTAQLMPFAAVGGMAQLLSARGQVSDFGLWGRAREFVMRAVFAAFLAMALTAGLESAAAATIQIGSNEVDTNFAATSVTTLNGTTEVVDDFGTGVTDLNYAAGGTLFEGVRCQGLDGCSFAVNFDFGVLNGDGDDLIIAGFGGYAGSKGQYAERFDLEINGVRISNLTLFETGDWLVLSELKSFTLKSLTIDLADFGIAVGDVINSITVIVNAGINAEEFTYLGLLNPLEVTSADARTLVNPIPGAAWLFGTALLGGGVMSRRKRKAVA